MIFFVRRGTFRSHCHADETIHVVIDVTEAAWHVKGAHFIEEETEVAVVVETFISASTKQLMFWMKLMVMFDIMMWMMKRMKSSVEIIKSYV